MLFFFFFNDTATTEIYTLSLHDALPISEPTHDFTVRTAFVYAWPEGMPRSAHTAGRSCLRTKAVRSEEHTSELQSLAYLVCRLLLEKKKMKSTVNERC